VSEYAVGPYHTLMTAAFGALTVGSTALTVALARRLPAPALSPAGLACLGLWSGAVAMAGACPTDLTGPDGRPVQRTPRGTVHGLAGVTAFLSLPLASVLLGRRFRRVAAWEAVAGPSVAMGLLQGALVVLSIRSPAARQGLAERLLIAVDLAWLAWLGLALRSRAR
jgi:hypothetical protein